MGDAESNNLRAAKIFLAEEGISKELQVSKAEGRDHLNSMLSLSFATPLAGAARTEKVKQMSNNHPAFEKSRKAQHILVTIQQSLRRMPGFSSAESSEIVMQLQEVGQIVSQETSALVDALMNLTLDQQDTDKAVARMSIEANLAKARIEDQISQIRELQSQLNAVLEHEMQQSKERAEEEGSNSSGGNKSVQDLEEKDEIIRTLQETNRHLEEQVNGRRTLWVMKHPDAHSLSRAIDTLRDSAEGFPAAQNALVSLRHNIGRANSENHSYRGGVDLASPKELGRLGGGELDKAMTSPDFYSRSSTQPPMGGFRGTGNAPPPIRPPSSAAFARRTNSSSVSSPWDQQQPQATAAAGSAARGASSMSINTSAFAAASFSRGGSASRNGMHSQGGSSRFSPSAAEFYPWNLSSAEAGNGHGNGNGNSNGGPVRQVSGLYGCNGGGGGVVGSNGHSNGNSGHSNGNNYHNNIGNNNRDYYPRTPTAASRGRYGRLQEAPPSAGSDSTAGGVSLSLSSAMVSNGSGNGNSGGGGGGSGGGSVSSTAMIAPLVHMNERSVAAWHGAIMEFYGVIRAFVERHAGQPDQTSSAKLSATGLWPVLLATYYPLSEAEAASYLEFHLRNESSKACLVTRVVIDYVVNRVWTPAAWTGADEDSTLMLRELERDMERAHGRPSAFRQPLLDRQAAIVDGILAQERERDSGFHAAKAAEVAAALLTNLRPLLNRSSVTMGEAAATTATTTPTTTVMCNGSAAAALRDMEAVAGHAWALSSRILTSRLTFDFRFPEIGSRFSSQSMVPIWPRRDPFELQARHWRVALVTTPVITCRNDTGTNISAHSVALADVFCMH